MRGTRFVLVACALASLFGTVALRPHADDHLPDGFQWEKAAVLAASETWVAVNPAQGLRLVYDRWLEFSPTAAGAWTWRVASGTEGARSTAFENRVDLLRDDAVSESVLNTPAGLTWRVALWSAASPMRLEMTGTLAPEVLRGRDEIGFKDEMGRPVLWLHGLHAADAAGREVAVHLDLEKAPGDGTVWVASFGLDAAFAELPIALEATYSAPATDLKLEVIEEPQTVREGETFERRLTVENLGPFEAVDVRVSHDARVDLLDTAGCLNDPGGAPCELGRLPSGDRIIYRLRGRVASCGAGPLAASLIASSSMLDPEPSNDAVELLIAAPCDEEPEGACDVDNDGFNGPQCAGPDCNDNNPAINPTAVEIPGDGVDQNCDALERCYQDVDNDNYGTATTITSVDLDCLDANEGPLTGDCNDGNASINPGATEIPGDGVDQNCDALERCYQDADNDNYGTAATITSVDLDCVDANEGPLTGDCNDGNASINPGATEIPGDGVDQNCDALERCYQDADNDNYGTAATITSVDLDCVDANEGPLTGDCNDGNASINPGAVEIPGDGVDQNCDALERCYQDVDNDNYGTAATITSVDLDCVDANEGSLTGDCNDGNASINPGATEIPGDGVDQNCDALERCYQDVDNDNYGTAATITSVDLDCVDANEGPLTGDCNDGNASINPGATEIPGDGVDQNCNAQELCYQDTDNDNYGTATTINSFDFDCLDLNEAPITGDCNDSSASIHPAAIEIPGDGVDQNCDTVEICYQDADNDNYGTATTITSVDLDCLDTNEGALPGDCNDGNPSINPGAIEVPADGVDQNCDALELCYQDVDNDNYGTTTTINSFDFDCLDLNEAPITGDCNDSSASIHPAAIEIPGDGADQNCDAVELCYQDADNDNYGTATTITSVDLDCMDANEGTLPGDCNDGNPSINPGVIEVPADGVDQNCDALELCYQDVDNDNYGTTTTINSFDFDCLDLNEAPITGDCNDSSASIHPAAIEIPGDGADQNCDAVELCYQDTDNDNYGTATTITSVDLDCMDANEGTLPGDCNDGNPSINPGATEAPADSVDQDCNGGDRCYQDGDDDDYGTTFTVASTDLDCVDLNEASVTGDCNDGNASINPGATEAPADSVDQDCNGGDRCYQDGDDDDYGTTFTVASTDLDCVDLNEATVTGDCNDGNASIHPAAVEIAGDGVDQNCDVQEVCYQDVDNDNYGTATTITSVDLDCVDLNEASVTGDCNDNNPQIYPGAPESCNAVDDNCDNVVDDGFLAPSGVPVLTLEKISGSTTIGWTAISSVTGYDVVRGDLALLRSTGGDYALASTTCLADQQVSTSISDGDLPGPSAGFWYLIRGTNCLTPGTWDSGAPQQQGSRDAEIGASPNACP